MLLIEKAHSRTERRRDGLTEKQLMSANTRKEGKKNRQCPCTQKSPPDSVDLTRFDFTSPEVNSHAHARGASCVFLDLSVSLFY